MTLVPRPPAKAYKVLNMAGGARTSDPKDDGPLQQVKKSELLKACTRDPIIGNMLLNRFVMVVLSSTVH